MPGFGLQPVDAWFTVHGEVPQMLTGALAQDRDEMIDALRSEEWTKLHGELMTYVTNYEQKIVRAKSSLQF